MNTTQNNKSTFQVINCLLRVAVALVFINFSVQFNNHIIAKIISISISTNQNAINDNIDIDFSTNTNTTEENNEESETNNNKNNSNKKNEYFFNHNNLCYFTSYNSVKNHFVMAYMDEVSLEIPSPPPWS
jgi:hypothetical protein